MAHIGKHNEKRSYERQPRIFSRGNHSSSKQTKISRLSLLQTALNEISFVIHEYKNLGCPESDEKKLNTWYVRTEEEDTHYEKIKTAIKSGYPNLWYIGVSLDKKANTDFNYCIRTTLGDKVYIKYEPAIMEDYRILFYIE